ncbi:FAD-dependent monooxygenase [Actinomadura rupiterrae]|uniref:FAD-dependent monooxygenase n=1 Tax=Actinomadura rupiterrae TaxID=559627 RepID=UPI0020A29A3F|nr:FAD-dependent monooxygenase [Actinomadura rupiterrae]MCP2341423.1 2-polyprenyl-6-methoxyphenol hydroxylase-like FAD-dependent oxidoreductase [Actinomadura rupiterrae]
MAYEESGRAVVLGAGIGGLLAARVLSEHYGEVVVVDRDELPDGPEHRRFVPQSHHAHGLLGSGRQVMVSLFPGLSAELDAAGAITSGSGDPAMGDRSIFLVRNGTTIRIPAWWTGGFCASRVLIEHSIRERVRAIPNVTLRDRTAAVGLLTSGTRRRVTGVRTEDGEVGADLVVDASGRNSALPEWLERIGYRPPEESVVHSDVRYASLVTEPDPSFDPEWLIILGAQATSGSSVGGVVLRIENGLLHMSFGTTGQGTPIPSDIGELRAFADRMTAPVTAEALRHSTPLGPVRKYHVRRNVRRYYDRMSEMPAGLVALGDAASASNPIYGQGMSVAALSASRLGRLLAEEGGARRPGFERRAARAIAATSVEAWRLALGEDLRYGCRTQGVRTPWTARFDAGYRNRLERAAALDPEVASAFNDVLNLHRPLSSLGSPRVVRRVLRPLRDRNPGPLSATIAAVLGAA